VDSKVATSYLSPLLACCGFDGPADLFIQYSIVQYSTVVLPANLIRYSNEKAISRNATVSSQASLGLIALYHDEH
jgi:hypothetical protein